MEGKLPPVFRFPVLWWIAGGMIIGDLAAGSVAMPYGPVASAVVLAGSGLLVGIGGWPGRFGWLAASGLWAALAADGVYRPDWPPEHVARQVGDRFLRLEGHLGDDLRPGPGGTVPIEVSALDGREGRVPATGRIRLRLRRVEQEWQAGDIVRLDGKLRRPRNFGTPGEFDMAAHLARGGVYATAFLEDDTRLRLVARPGLGSGDWLARWRRRVAARIEAGVAAPASGVLRALVVGQTDGVDPALRRTFAAAGVSHVLAISGLHVGLVALSSWGGLRWLLGRSEWLLLNLRVPAWAAAGSLLPVALYAGIAGGGLATVRAVLMAGLFALAVVVNRAAHLQVVLAAAAVAILATRPGSSRSISFQLSFLAVWALALATQRFQAAWPAFAERHDFALRTDWQARWARPFLLSLTISASALVATAPLTALHFHQVSLIAPLTNLLVVPLLGWAAVAVGLLAAFLEPFVPELSGFAFRIAGWATLVGVRIVEILAATPGGSWRVPTPTLPEVILWLGAFGTFTGLTGRARRRAGVLLLVCLAFFSALRIGTWLAPPELRATFLSIGQGDATVLELPSGEVFVVDGGGMPGGGLDVGERIVAPFLWWRRHSRVDILALSHPQFDHYGGFLPVVEGFRPREFWTSGRRSDTVSYRALEAALREQGVGEKALRRGFERNFGAVRVRGIGPPAGAPPARNVNDDSLVLEVTFGGRRLLLPGDIEARAESELLAGREILPVDVLKVPHHGSRTSSTAAFVARARPAIAVVSAGWQNRHGFPHRDVVRRYLAAGTLLLRTDLEGAIEVRIRADGQIGWRRFGARPSRFRWGPPADRVEAGGAGDLLPPERRAEAGSSSSPVRVKAKNPAGRSLPIAFDGHRP